MTYSKELRLKKPKLGLETDYKNSRKSAIQLFCLDCVGGERKEAVNCSVSTCPLWQFRPGAVKNVKPMGIPSENEYNNLIKSSTTQEQIDKGKNLANKRWEKNLNDKLGEI